MFLENVEFQNANDDPVEKLKNYYVSQVLCSFDNMKQDYKVKLRISLFDKNFQKI